jgi:transposase
LTRKCPLPEISSGPRIWDRRSSWSVSRFVGARRDGLKQTRRKIDAALNAKVALEALRERSSVARTRPSDTRCIQTRYTPGRSSFESGRRGRSTLISGEIPRISGSRRSRSYSPGSASCRWSGIFSQEVSRMSAPDRRALVDREECRVGRCALRLRATPERSVS